MPTRAKDVSTFTKNSVLLSRCTSFYPTPSPLLLTSRPRTTGSGRSRGWPSAPRYTTPAGSALRFAHPLLFKASPPSPLSVLEPSSQENALFSSGLPSLYGTPSASISNALFYEGARRKCLNHEPQPTSLQKGNTDLRDGLSKRKVVFKNFGRALQQETVARRAMLSASGAVQSQVSDLRAGNLSVKKLNQELMQENLPASYKNTGKNIDRFFAVVHTGTLKIFLDVE